MTLLHRKATQEETRLYLETYAEARFYTKTHDLKGIEQIKYIHSKMRDLQIYAMAGVGSFLLWAPTPDQIFEAWCTENNFDLNDPATAVIRFGWNAGKKDAKEQIYDPELKAELEEECDLTRGIRNA